MGNPHVEKAHGLSREAFVALYPGFFLLKRPRQSGASSTPAPEFGFATIATKVDIDPFAHEWLVLPVSKRAGNPFPERLTIGRAQNNDIVLRVPFVSKLHAHILLEPDQSFSLQDNRSARGSFHNQRRLVERETFPLKLGDVLGFGSLEFEFVDGARLYDVLRAEAR